MPRGHTAKTCSGRRAAQSGAVIIGRRMVYAQHPLLPQVACKRPVRRLGAQQLAAAAPCWRGTRHAWVVGRQPRSLGSRGQRPAESCVPLPAAPCSGYGTGQETAAFISPATFCSTAGLHVCSANDTGHRSPSSRFAASWNSSVEYRVLNLPEFLKQTTTLPSALA